MVGVISDGWVAVSLSLKPKTRKRLSLVDSGFGNESFWLGKQGLIKKLGRPFIGDRPNSIQFDEQNMVSKIGYALVLIFIF